MRKNLIEIEEAHEAKICEGSKASSILNDHRKNMKKLVMGNKHEESGETSIEQVQTNATDVF